MTADPIMITAMVLGGLVAFALGICVGLLPSSSGRSRTQSQVQDLVDRADALNTPPEAGEHLTVVARRQAEAAHLLLQAQALNVRRLTR